jgi:hypothetical protein
MDKQLYDAIAELGNFFRQLCCRTQRFNVLKKLKAAIPNILYKLKKISPSFFDAMVHLAIHLPDNVMLRGPIQYGWMCQNKYGALGCHTLF